MGDWAEAFEKAQAMVSNMTLEEKVRTAMSMK